MDDIARWSVDDFDEDDDTVPTDGAVQVAVSSVEVSSVEVSAGDDMAEVAAMLAAMLTDEEMSNLEFYIKQQRAITKAMRIGRGKGDRWV